MKSNDYSIVLKLFIRRVLIARRFGGSFFTTYFSIEQHVKGISPWRQTSFFPLYASSWRSSEYTSGLFTAINLSGEVQSEHSTEGNTCMTSSEDNRVSIPPKGQKSVCQIPGAGIHPIGLESGCQMTGVVFHLNNWLFIHSVDFTGFSAETGTGTLDLYVPIVRFCSRIPVLCVSCSIIMSNLGI